MTFSGYLNVYNFQRVLLATRKAEAIALQASCMLLRKGLLSTSPSQTRVMEFIIINVCFYMETMLNRFVYICKYHQGNLTRDQWNHEWGTTHGWIAFWWNKTYKFVEFTSELKTGLSSVERIYSVYRILENAKTGLYGYKRDDVFETNPIPYIFLLSRDENPWSIE